MVKLDCLAFGAHPDDVELACSGTLINFINSGGTVGLIDLTRGELGSRGSADLRTIEGENSRKEMGASIRENLDMADGFFDFSDDNLLKVVRVIRKYKPRIILANAPKDRHPDHGRGAELVSRAVFLSGLVRINTTYNGEVQEKWRPQTVLHYIQDRHIIPQVVFDITDSFDQKMKCIHCFSSQFFNPESEDVDTPISGRDFQAFIEAKARVFGREVGVEFGEGFVCDRPVGFESLSSVF